MIQPTRVRVLADVPPASQRKYVLYWMQQSQRVRFNHALEYAVEQANELKLPLVVCFGLMDDYPEANERHYAFMLDGLRDVQADLKERGIRFVCRHGNPPDAALSLAGDAALVVCDRGYLRHQKRWRDKVADEAGVRVVEVESDVVVPVDEVSNRQEYAARTIRPKINKRRDEYLVPLKPTAVQHESLRLRVSGDIDVSQPADALAKLKLDRSVKPVSREGGSTAAHRLLKHFLQHKLPGYDEGRNEPAAGQTSLMSAHLHFGQISPVEIAIAVRDAKHAPQEDRDAYLEELIVRRELAANFVHHCPHYDTYDCIPDWAKKTLTEREKDPRPHLYTLEQLEHARTADPYWNAAQLEMTRTGFMHNYMRMYWGKKILEWMPTAREAFQTTLYLNNKYFLCGRDMISFASVAWIYGLHDRPWGPARKVFGTVRYMNDNGLRRKFDMDAYVKKVALL